MASDGFLAYGLGRRVQPFGRLIVREPIAFHAGRPVCGVRTPFEQVWAIRVNEGLGPAVRLLLAEARASVNATRTAGADTFAATVAPVIAEAQASGAKSLRQIAAALNGRGVATARGGRWEAATVANVLKRVAA
jgi:hypothetical protein